jgi:signal transduction histidine kinase
VAHSLHDEVQQQLVLVSLSLDDLRRSAPSVLAPRIEHTLRQIDEVSDRVRTLSHELRPRVLDDLGLVPALELLAQGMARRHHVRIDILGSAGGRLKPAVETALYRVAQEGLQNVVRHAAAERIEIRLERTHDRLRFMVHDDGRGFDPLDVARRANAGLGLIGMRERVQGVGGALHVESSPGQGTRLTALVPVGDSRGPDRRSN